MARAHAPRCGDLTLGTFEELSVLPKHGGWGRDWEDLVQVLLERPLWQHCGVHERRQAGECSTLDKSKEKGKTVMHQRYGDQLHSAYTLTG